MTFVRRRLTSALAAVLLLAFATPWVWAKGQDREHAANEVASCPPGPSTNPETGHAPYANPETGHAPYEKPPAGTNETTGDPGKGPAKVKGKAEVKAKAEGPTTSGAENKPSDGKKGDKSSAKADDGSGKKAHGSSASSAQRPPECVPPAAPPAVEKTVNVEAPGGLRVKRPHDGGFVILPQGGSVPVGSLVDARRGAVALTSARDADGTPQTVTFSGALVKVRQDATTHGVTQLVLRGGDRRACRPRPTRVRATTSAVHVVRRLWARDHHGRFATRGSYGAASVRGTVWLTEDRCDGTFTRVTDGAVVVHDFARHRNVVVSAGHGYLVRAPHPG